MRARWTLQCPAALTSFELGRAGLEERDDFGERVDHAWTPANEKRTF
nr:hypothetical protein [Dyella mobilis]